MNVLKFIYHHDYDLVNVYITLVLNKLLKVTEWIHFGDEDY